MAQLVPVVESLTDTYEIKFIKDCGDDATWSIIESLATEGTRVRGIRPNRKLRQRRTRRMWWTRQSRIASARVVY